MNLRDFSEIPTEIVEIFEKEGITTLYPPQVAAIPPALSGKNLVLSMPTASGKSLPAYLAVLKHALKGGKAVYIVPLKSLATEKYDDFKKFEKIGIKVTATTSDYDKRQDFEKYDIIVCTAERIDSLLRRPLQWLHNVTIVVADEIHLLNDLSRGATLEIVLTKFKLLNKTAQLIGLSATIGNPDRIANWLGAEVITSDFRPTILHEGIFSPTEDKIFFVKSKNPLELQPHTVNCIYSAETIGKLCIECIQNGGQNLIFVNKKRSAESVAKKLAELFEREKISLPTNYEQNILGEDEHSVALRNCVKAGVAFHTAVLTADQRRVVERGFKEGVIKCIVATPTLAAGINLPARRVIIRDVDRWTGRRERIPVLEIKQYEGRAGRPKYDKEGEAIFIEKPNDKFASMDALLENYILADVEPLQSKLAREEPLRAHTLALIASEFATRKSEILKFYQATFFCTTATASQIEEFEKIIEDALLFLCEGGFVKVLPTYAYSATEFGRLTAALCINPLSATILRDALIIAKQKFAQKPIPTAVFLQPLALTPDMIPFRYKYTDGWVEGLVEEYSEDLLLPMPENEEEYAEFLAAFKTACLLADWANEIDDKSLVDRFGIGMGEVHERIEKACWLLYAQQVFDKLFKTGLGKFIRVLEQRVKHGVKEELLQLCALRNIGRARARSLFNHGIKNYLDIKSASVKKLSAAPLIGVKIALSLKEQVEKLGV